MLVLNVEEMADRLSAAYLSANSADLQEGLAWYGRAASEMAAIANWTGLPFTTVTGICAAMSPRCQWSVNVAWTWQICEAHRNETGIPRVGLGANLRKATAILVDGMPLKHLSGPKTRSFYRAIAGSENEVCVDGWAAYAATGLIVGTGGLHLYRAGRYAAIQQAYRIAALRIGRASPRDFQAIVWVATRRKEGGKLMPEEIEEISEIPD